MEAKNRCHIPKIYNIYTEIQIKLIAWNIKEMANFINILENETKLFIISKWVKLKFLSWIVTTKFDNKKRELHFWVPILLPGTPK